MGFCSYLQRAKKLVSASPVMEDFAFRLVISILKAQLFNVLLKKKSDLSSENDFWASTSGLACNSLPKGQSGKSIFFAPGT